MLRSVARTTSRRLRVAARPIAARPAPRAAAANLLARPLGVPPRMLSTGAAAVPAPPPTPMFCFQCEQTQDTTGCTTSGVCGKTPTTARMQDMLVHALVGLGTVSHKAKEMGIDTGAADAFVLDAFFSTLTNVNFAENRFPPYIQKAIEHRDALLKQVGALTGDAAGPYGDMHPASWTPAGYTVDQLLADYDTNPVGVQRRLEAAGKTLGGLHEFLTYGLKGMAAYSHHAHSLGAANPEVFAYIQEALAFLGSEKCMDVGATLEMLLKCGEANVKVLAMLDGAHVSKYGAPVPTEVATSPSEGKCILVSGHDLLDLEHILQQSEGKGVNVYTHGEMLPAHGYPSLKKYPHLKGNYGSAWQNQKMEFGQFPGPIVMTSNCIVEPRKSYKERIFTCGPVGFDGVKHIEGEPGKRDFSSVVETALAMDGFAAQTAPATATTTGFSHSAILGLADQVVGAVKEGQIEHFIVVGGCDGSEGERSYFKDVVVNSSPQTVILTLGCGKYRFNKLDTGVVPGLGIPRVLDMGQCNDAYGAVVVALKLAEVFGTDVNGLPLSLCISWFEQKAAAVLLSLLHLGVRGITLGPQLPAFITPEALGVIVEKFGVRPANVDNAQADLDWFLASAGKK